MQYCTEEGQSRSMTYLVALSKSEDAENSVTMEYLPVTWRQ